MSRATTTEPPRRRIRDAPHRKLLIVSGLAFLAFLTIGSYGAYRYLWNFWYFRGYAAPTQPASVVVSVNNHVYRAPVLKGVVKELTIKSTALGGLEVPVVVYLPPGYTTSPHRHYPVFYLLHGRPGQPIGFLAVADMGASEDELVAAHKLNPMILVMPGSGEEGLFTPDNEWANGVGKDSAWETFIARDVVNTIDARYRTIKGSDGRAIAGLSEGAFGAMNIGLHHLNEFGVIQSWSGYFLAAKVPSVFGRSPKVIGENSPLKELPSLAPTMRRDHTYIWYYCGTHDYDVSQNYAYAAALRLYHVNYTFLTRPGGHTWALWRSMSTLAMTAVSTHLADD